MKPEIPLERRREGSLALAELADKLSKASASLYAKSIKLMAEERTAYTRTLGGMAKYGETDWPYAHEVRDIEFAVRGLSDFECEVIQGKRELAERDRKETARRCDQAVNGTYDPGSDHAAFIVRQARSFAEELLTACEHVDNGTGNAALVMAINKATEPQSAFHEALRKVKVRISRIRTEAGNVVPGPWAGAS